MKKFIGVVLVIVLAVTGLAFAEGQSANFESRYTLVRFQTLGYESYALIGEGDGTEAFATFASDDAAYADRYEDFWKTLSLLEPAQTLSCEFADLTFAVSEDGKNTVVSMDGTTVMEIEGLDSFAIVYNDAVAVKPSVDASCDLHIWTAETSGADGELCAHCGQIDDGSSKHDALISEFCDEGHTKCMGDPVHHCDECGKDYVCSKSNSHTTCAVCGKAWCDKSEGNHVELECGHRGCEVYGKEEEHEKCEACGEYLCNGESHEHPVEDDEETNTESGSEAEEGTNTESGAEIPEGEVNVEGDAA